MGERYKDLALRYLQDEALFDPLAKGSSPLKGKRAHSHVSALNSAVQAYLVTGQPKYRSFETRAAPTAISGSPAACCKGSETGAWNNAVKVYC
jgi:hypothetical protein